MRLRWDQAFQGIVTEKGINISNRNPVAAIGRIDSGFGYYHIDTCSISLCAARVLIHVLLVTQIESW
jgi:hypothetical protein